MPRRRYRSKHTIPSGVTEDVRALRSLGVLLSWIAHVLGIPSTALRYRTNNDYPRLYRKSSTLPK